MTANLAYWLFAYALMTVTLVIGVRGVIHVRAGRFEAHRKAMVLACNILLFFVLTYVLKVVILGREDKTDWTTLDLVILRVHESFIGIMLIAGTWSRLLARKYKDRLDNPTEADLPIRRRHALAGKIALAAAFCALGTATGVLWVLFRLQGLV